MIDIENSSENSQPNNLVTENTDSYEKTNIDEIMSEQKTGSQSNKTFFKTARKSKEVEELKVKVAELNDKYIRLSAEFDNYKKRTLKEKMEIIKAGGENIIINILPVIDDLERAMESINKTDDKQSIKEGINLIYSKFKEFLTQNGIKEIESKNLLFDTDLHEAVTKIPAPDENLKGKIVDVIQKGYFLNDKVIRFSKVVIGE
jgi:molecular chaperone GrpE